MALKKFFSELKRRNVYKVAITYIIVAWLILQIGSVVFETIKTPDWVMQVLLFFIVIGFPIALILAWAFEMSPKGMIRTNSLESDENPYPLPKKKPLANKFFIGVLIFIVIAQFGYNKFWTGKEIDISDINETSELENSIAVLPLINLSEDDSLEYFSDGITLEITDELSKIKTFTMTSFAQSYQFKDSMNKSHIDIANELEVNYITTGSARVYGDSIKISIELFNPRSKERIWNGTYSEEMDNAPKIQLAIAKQVAKSLNIKLSREEEKSLETVKTIDGEAFKLFLKAKADFKSMTPEGFSKSINALEMAIELDPNYAQAITFMAWVNILNSSSWLGGGNYSPESIRLITSLLERSISLKPKNSDTYLVKGNLNLFVNGLLGEAKKNVEYALELNSWPKTPTDYCICTVVSTYVALGDIERAKEVANIARVVDPGNVFIFWDQANLHMMEGEFKKAQALYEEAVQSADIPYFNFFLGWSYYHDNQYSKALEYFEKVFQSVDVVPIYMNVAYMSNSFFKLGNKVKSEEFRLELKRRMDSGSKDTNLAMAMIAAAQSNNDETLFWLEKAQRNLDTGFAYMVNVDPIFKQILEEPRFIEMRRKMQYYD